MRSFSCALSLALFATLAQLTLARSLHDRCAGLRLFEQKLQSAKQLAWLGDECVGYEFEPSTTREHLIGELKQLLDTGDSQLHRSVKQFKEHLKDHTENQRPAELRTQEFFAEILPAEPGSKSFAYFYRYQSVFALSLHRLRWELAKNELFVELGKAPELENQKLRNGLKDEAEYQLHWLKFIGCRLRKLVELEDAEPNVVEAPENWNNWKCDGTESPNVLHPACLTRNKVVNVKLTTFLASLNEFLIGRV